MTDPMLDAVSAAAPWALLTAGLILIVAIDPHLPRRSRGLLLTILGLMLTMMAAEIAEYAIAVSTPRDLARTCFSVFGYAVRPLLLALLMQTLCPPRRAWPCWALVGLHGAVCLASIPTGLAVRFEQNIFHRGPLNWLCLAVSALLLADLTVRLFRATPASHRRELLLICFADGLIAAGAAMDFVQPEPNPVGHLTMAIVGASFFYFFWYHMQQARLHEERKLESLQAEHHIRLMISQIQPHFLYNTLSTIQALCRIDPERASDLVEQFGHYLRRNLDSLSDPSLVPFEKEMEHTKTYAEIEQVRFPSIHITYDLKDMDFSVPALTVQPLVENAIRHGVRIRRSGEILIRSRLEDREHVVLIRDNGKGFDAENALQLERDHIGLRNVRERVEQMCGGSMEIDSRLGEGTTIVLRFPRGKEQA